MISISPSDLSGERSSWLSRIIIYPLVLDGGSWKTEGITNPIYSPELFNPGHCVGDYVFSNGRQILSERMFKASRSNVAPRVSAAEEVESKYMIGAEVAAGVQSGPEDAKAQLSWTLMTPFIVKNLTGHHGDYLSLPQSYLVETLHVR